MDLPYYYLQENTRYLRYSTYLIFTIVFAVFFLLQENTRHLRYRYGTYLIFTIVFAIFFLSTGTYLFEPPASAFSKENNAIQN
jgi:hypothetical protein